MFEEVVGNEKTKESLEKIIKSGNVSHSYIFSGSEGIGKILFAKKFAKAVLCTNREVKCCERCTSCVMFAGSNNPDYFVIEPDGSRIKIGQIREMQETVLEKPIIAKRKVYIINNGELMTKEAQNSLLKTLEEPPEYICIILVSSNDNMLLSTIKSRCTKITFNKLTNQELKNVMLEVSEVGKSISDNLIRIADGNVTRALELEKKEEMFIKIEDAFSKLGNKNVIDMINLKDEVFKEYVEHNSSARIKDTTSEKKEDVQNALEYINLMFFERLRESNDERYTRCIELVENTKERLRKNNNFDMTIDRFLIKTWEILQEGE